MSSKKRVKTALKQKTAKKFEFYCKHSSIHGVNYFYKSTSWVHRIAWCAILICAAGLNIYLTHMIWQQYTIDPTVTVVESTHYPTNNLAFPGIVLCASDLVFVPQADKLIEILIRRGVRRADIVKFLDSILTLETSHFDVDSTVSKIHSLLDDIGYPFWALLDVLSKPCEVLLVKCLWRSQEHKCSDMFHRVLTYKGYCCLFIIEYFRQHTDNETNLIAYPDRTKAMEVVINNERIFANGTRAFGSAELFVYDASDKLTVVDSSVTLMSKTYYDVSIDVSAMVASENVKNLPMNVRRCILPTDTQSGSSFYSGCVSNFLMREIVSSCKCLPYFITVVTDEMNGYPNCSWNHYRCVMQTRQDFSGSPTDMLSFKFCYQKCDYTQYEVQLEYVELYSSIVDNLVTSDKNTSYSQISVHISDKTCIKYRREVLFTWDQLLASIGGIFGLCMGGSIISIIEFVWFMLDLAYLFVYEKFTKKMLTKHTKQNNTVFTVSKTNTPKVEFGVNDSIKKHANNNNKIPYLN